MSADKLTLSLSTEQANLILDALGQQPFIKVYELIDHIQHQASEQAKSNQLTDSSEQAKSNQLTDSVAHSDTVIDD